MRSALFCSTPYQILVAIIIRYYFPDSWNTDIYVLNHFHKAEYIVRNLKLVKLFSKVDLVECVLFRQSLSKNRLIRLLQRIMMYKFPQKITDKYFDFDDSVYDQIYFSHPDLINQLAAKELFKRNKNMKIHLFDDGVGSYDTNILKVTNVKKAINIITNSHSVVDKYDSLLMLRPDLYSGETEFPKIKIPVIEDQNFKDIINTVFEYNDNQQIKEKIVYFEQPLEKVPELNVQIRNIIDKVLVDDYIVKLHPRSNSEDYSEHKIYDYNFLPWEIISINQNIDDKILISYYSSALTSNKIMFDKEPILIFLYEMKELKKFYELDPETQQFVANLRAIYEDPNRVFIPHDLNELQDYLSDLMR